METQEKINRITEINKLNEANHTQLEQLYKMKLFLEGKGTPTAYISFRDNGGHGWPSLVINNKGAIQNMIGLEIEKIQIKNAQLTLIGFEDLAGVSGGGSGGALIGVGTGGFISQVSVSGHLSCFYQCGGIAGTLQDHSINDSSASTIVYNGDSDASGLVGELRGSSTINRSFAFGKVFGLKSAWGIAKGGVINQSYWGIQATSQTTGSDGTLNDSEGLNTNELQCPTGPDDITCKPGSTLYDGWDDIIWNFGTGSDFPKLQWTLDIGDLIYRNGFEN